MKNQYFGDERDFFKFAILRAFGSAGLKVFVDWMLTPDDLTSDGRKMDYLSQPEWRQHDEALFDWFFEWRRVGKAKSVALIQDAGVLQVTGFFGDLVPQPVV